MAVTKTHPIKTTLNKAIAYICNPEKTDDTLLVSSFGCSAETADILDEDHKINAQKFESAFYANPDLRNVKPPQEPEKPQAQTLDLAALVEQLQKSPELANTLAALLSAQRAG